MFKINDRVIWYDYRLWGPKDINHNKHCYKPEAIGVLVR